MHRYSRRYLLVRLLSANPIPEEVIERTVRSYIEQTVGSFGEAEMKVRMIGFDETSAMAVFSCRSDSVERLRGILTLMTHAGGSPVAATVVRSSGTIKALRAPVRKRVR